jgi:Tfp pilus assembly protein PilP
VAGLVTVTKSVGHEIQNLEGQESGLQSLRYHYEPHNRREPFLPLVIPEFRKLSSSSSIELSQTHKPTWKLLGIISGRQGYYASIQNSEGKRYIVTLGSVIPSEGLKVKRISKTELELDYLDKRTVTTNLERSQKLIVSF